MVDGNLYSPWTFSNIRFTKDEGALPLPTPLSVYHSAASRIPSSQKLECWVFLFVSIACHYLPGPWQGIGLNQDFREKLDETAQMV